MSLQKLCDRQSILSPVVSVTAKQRLHIQNNQMAAGDRSKIIALIDRQCDRKLGSLTQYRRASQTTAVYLFHYLATDRQTQPRPFTN
jgi:hypothetical protein